MKAVLTGGVGWGLPRSPASKSHALAQDTCGTVLDALPRTLGHWRSKKQRSDAKAEVWVGSSSFTDQLCLSESQVQSRNRGQNCARMQ